MPYFHVVYTLPSELRDDTTLSIASDPKRLGARIGVTTVLHNLGLGAHHIALVLDRLRSRYRHSGS